MYQWPEAHPNNWSAIITAAAYVGILVLNPNSGPSTAPIGEFVDAAERCQAAGISVIGYVDSAYGSKSISDVQTEINNYISWYQVNGFFIDDMYSHGI